MARMRPITLFFLLVFSLACAEDGQDPIVVESETDTAASPGEDGRASAPEDAGGELDVLDTGKSGDVTGPEDTQLNDSAELDVEEEVSDSTESDGEVADVEESEDAGAGDTVEEEEVPEVAKKGPYNTGFREVDFAYDLPGLDEPRTITLGMFYPTNDTDGEGLAWGGLLPEEDLFVGASLAPPVGEKYPVRVYTHGNVGIAGDSSNTSEFFASHGWVTIAPNHTGNTMFDFIDPRPAWMYYARNQDVRETMDFAENLPESDPLSGLLFMEQVFLVGHSYGGYTGYGVAGATFDLELIATGCAEGGAPLGGTCTEVEYAQFEDNLADPRVAAYAPVDGGNANMYGEAGVQAIELPMLQMYAIDPQEGTHSGSEIYWSWLQNKNMTRVGIDQGCHWTFTIGFCPGISDADGYEIVHAYLFAFARHHILGDTSPEVLELLSGETSISDQALYEATSSAVEYWDSLLN